MSEPTTLRDAIEAAIEEPPQEAPQAAPEAPAPEAQASEPSFTAEASDEPSASAEPDLNALAEEQGQPRDDEGKFASKMQAGPKPGPKQPADKAPASWKPEVREHWQTLPETVRSEIARREVEHARFMQETAEARRTADAVSQVVQPYMHFIKAEGSNPIQAIDNLMATAARLRTGTAPELATMVAEMVTQFGTDRFGLQFIEMLDSALAGKQPRAADPQTSQIEQLLNQKLAPVQGMLNQFQQAQAQAQYQAQSQAQNEVAQFLSNAEFGEDVREDMADILEAAQRRGQTMTLQQAYEKATFMNDNVRKVMQQRQMLQGSQVQTQAAQRARAAAVSVSGAAPIGAMQQPATDIRSAIEAAIQQTSR
jgi:hypothetical protein